MAAPTLNRQDHTQYIGNPMVYKITPTGSGAAGTFYHVKITVVANMTYVDQSTLPSTQKTTADETFVFIAPITVISGSAQPVLIDIASALQAVAEQWRPTEELPMVSSTVTYPSIKFYVTAQEEWMVDGTLYTSDVKRDPNSGYAPTKYLGALTDLERLAGTLPSNYRYSRKPIARSDNSTYLPEIVNWGGIYFKAGPIYSGANTMPPSVSTVYLTTLGTDSTNKLYVVKPTPDSYQIRFINGFGVHENIFVRGLPTREANITTEKYVIAKQELLRDFSRGIAIKKNDYETWTFTSGPIDEKWAEWYTHEFLMVRWAWIYLGNRYHPCHILPDDSVLITDRKTPSRFEIQFKLQFDINGSPMLPYRV